MGRASQGKEGMLALVWWIFYCVQGIGIKKITSLMKGKVEARETRSESKARIENGKEAA